MSKYFKFKLAYSINLIRINWFEEIQFDSTRPRKWLIRIHSIVSWIIVFFFFLIINAYLFRYLSSKQPWRAASFSHLTARSCLIDTLSRYRSLDSGGLSFTYIHIHTHTYTTTKKGTSAALPRERCGEIAEIEPMRKVMMATFRAICVGRGSRAKLIRGLTRSMF